MELKALESAGRSATAWAEGYDGGTHYLDVARALVPAFAILAAAVILMLVIL